jgi:ATP-dependent helicase HrpB
LSRFSLPVEECLDNLKRHLFERDEVILQAPPGAGKTTLVPLAQARPSVIACAWNRKSAVVPALK